MFLNNVTLVGNLTRDPETKVIPSGSQVTSFSIAINKTWFDKSGQKQESVEFVNIVVWGKQAESCSKFLKKGQSVLVIGELKTRSWEGDDGAKHYKTEVQAQRVQFGSRPGKKNPENSPAEEEEANQSKLNKEAPKVEKGYDYPQEEINPEDIPF